MGSGSPKARPKRVTLILPYYENPRMLQRQLETLASYDASTRKHFELIVVDDGSRAHPARLAPCVVRFSLYRCLVDVRWNWLFCRNLGVSRARSEWVLMTDIDHLVPAATARALVHGAHDPEHAYTFSRVSAPSLERYSSHKNSWFMTRKLFDAIGGYDERFSGLYGSDIEFRYRVRARARVVELREVLVRVPRSVVADASTTKYTRISDLVRIQRIEKLRGDKPPSRLTFPSERVDGTDRRAPSSPIERLAPLVRVRRRF